MSTQPEPSQSGIGDVVAEMRLPYLVDDEALVGSDKDGSTARIIVGDAGAVLRSFPSNIFQCCITSPPYWGLRDYAVPSQIGAETELTDYLQHLCTIFEEVRRVLSPDGTLWLNIGDSYTSGNRTWRAADRKNGARAMGYRPQTPIGLKPKDLIGVPWRVAFALQEAGWYLRSDIVWYKPNCQPESVRDRPTQAHEYVFLLSKSQDYYYNYDAVREVREDKRGMRNRRTVWQINTAPFPKAHFATFPPELVDPCILAGTRPGDSILDPFFGAGTIGVVARKRCRGFTGIEIKRAYAELAAERLNFPVAEIEDFHDGA
jgi:site-specific DNA-methyltransferase (adenine-specific)/site-specific DNA-methyltransferase (cytosine-N4-specific)